MYLYATYEEQQAREFVSKPFPSGGEWPEVQQRVHTVEVWASNIDEPATDHYTLIAFDSDGQELARKKVLGY